MKSLPRRALGMCLAFALWLGTAQAQAPTLSGRWSMSALRVDWKIGEWGASCGPRPSGGGAPGGTVSVSDSGGELAFRGGGRDYSTRECWEQFPGLTRSSHLRGGRSWKNVCKTPPADARQANLVTTITATDTRIQFDETGQYQFVVQKQNCTASVRRTRVYDLLLREGSEPAAPAASSAPLVASAAPERRCAVKGPPDRLEVRPSRKLMRPGESFTFRSAVLDAAGCVLGLAPVWRVVSGGDAVQLLRAGHVVVASGALESEARLQASLGDRAVNVIVEVASSDRYDDLLRQGSFNAEGESSEAAIARIASGSIGARSAVVQDEARGRRVWFIGIVGSIALALGMLGLFLVRRGRKQETAAAKTAPVLAAIPTAPARRDPPRICPTCREEFPPDAEFCAFDGNRLVPLTQVGAIGPTGGVCPVCGQGYDPGVTACPKHHEPLVPALVDAERRRSASVTRKICPVCGTQFPGDGQFCGKCGAALVPVN